MGASLDHLCSSDLAASLVSAVTPAAYLAIAFGVPFLWIVGVYCAITQSRIRELERKLPDDE